MATIRPVGDFRPRLVALHIAMPLLTIIADTISLAGGYVMAAGYNVNMIMYWKSLTQFMVFQDLIEGLAKPAFSCGDCPAHSRPQSRLALEISVMEGIAAKPAVKRVRGAELDPAQLHQVAGAEVGRHRPE